MACQNIRKQGRDDMHESKDQHIGKAHPAAVYVTRPDLGK